LTRADIIDAAFRVWGARLYKRTSLAELAAELGVTKPALYRHFRNKEAVSAALFDAFFDRFADFLRPGFEQAARMENPLDGLVLLCCLFSEYFARNRDHLAFAFIKVFGNIKTQGHLTVQLEQRGMDMQRLFHGAASAADYPLPGLVMVATVFCMLANLQKTCFPLFSNVRNGSSAETAAAAEVGAVDAFVKRVEDRICFGLRLQDAGEIDFERLEHEAEAEAETRAENPHRPLLEAVARTVAEKGPWNASMEMVARASGLSKSSLYSHFKSKEDMLYQLFLTEFEHIISFAEACSRKSAVGAEQLYLAIVSIALYLRSKSAILTALDWIRTRLMGEKERGLEVNFPPPPAIDIYQIFSHIRGADGRALVSPADAECILFLLVAVLTHRPAGMDLAAIPDESFRVLYKFIAHGVKG
jgi:AcrR family transcriptional regulator